MQREVVDLERREDVGSRCVYTCVRWRELSLLWLELISASGERYAGVSSKSAFFVSYWG